MTSFARLHHVWLESFINLVVEVLLWLIWWHNVVITVLSNRASRWMRQRADVTARVVNV